MYGTGQLRTRPTRGRPMRDLPQYYYHSNFGELLGFVCERYTPCFGEDIHAFIDGFRALPLHAQYLYVRLASRKGAVFPVEKVNYEEIHNLPDQMEC